MTRLLVTIHVLLTIEQCVLPHAWSTVDRPPETLVHRPSDIRVDATHTNLIIDHPTLIVHQAPILYHRPAAVVSPPVGRRPPPKNKPARRPMRRTLAHRRNALRIAAGTKTPHKVHRKPCKCHRPKAVVVPPAASVTPPAGEVVEFVENERNEYVVDEAQLDPKRLYVEAVYLPGQ